MAPALVTGGGRVIAISGDRPGQTPALGLHLSALALDGAILWHQPLPGAQPPGLLVDAKGQLWLAFGEQRTEVWSAEGAPLQTLKDVGVAALGVSLAVGVGRVGEGRAIVGLGLDGTRRWDFAIGRSSSAPILTNDGWIWFAEDTHRNDLDSGSTEVRGLRADGRLGHSFRLSMNGFSGPLLAGPGGDLFVTGIWANQYPPFQALVGSVWTPTSGLAAGAWPRGGRDNRNSHFAGPVVAGAVSAAGLRDWWRAEAAPWRMLYVGDRQEAWSEVAEGALAYGVYRADTLGHARLAERGTLVVTAGAVQLTPTWRSDGPPPGPYARVPSASDPWRVGLADPLAGGKIRPWRRVYGLLAPPSPLDDALQVDWDIVLLSKPNERPRVLSVFSKPGQLFVGGSYVGEGTAFGDPASAGAPCCYATSAFSAGIDLADLDHAWVDYEVAKEGDAGRQLRALPGADGDVVVLSAAAYTPAAKASGELFALRRFAADGAGPSRVVVGASAGFPGDVRDMVADAGSGASVCGRVIGVGAIAGQSVGEQGGSMTWLARLDAKGALVSVATVANPSHWALVQRATRDVQGRMWLVGTAQARSGGLGKDEALAVWRLDAAGHPTLQRLFASKLAYGETIADVVTGPSGEAAIFGAFRGSLKLAGVTHETAPDLGAADAFVVGLSPEGDVRWADVFAGPGPQIASAGVVDAHGLLYGGGVLGGALGQHGEAAAVLQQPTYVAYSRCGVRLLTRSIEADTEVPGVSLHPIAMARDADDRVFAAAAIYGPLRLAGTSLPSPLSQGENVALHRLSSPSAAARAVLEALGPCPEASPEDAPSHVVTVQLTGTGQGRVTSDPPGIDCPGACAADFAEAQPVTLTAKAEAGAAFYGWSGDCVGVGDCVIAKSIDGAVVARLDKPGVEHLSAVGGAGQEAVLSIAPASDGVVFLAQT